MVERIKAYEGRSGQKFLPDSDVVNHVWDITHGHPAGVQAMFNLLVTSAASIMDSGDSDLEWNIFAYWSPFTGATPLQRTKLTHYLRDSSASFGKSPKHTEKP